jgi:hypothetical protein
LDVVSAMLLREDAVYAGALFERRMASLSASEGAFRPAPAFGGRDAFEMLRRMPHRVRFFFGTASLPDPSVTATRPDPPLFTLDVVLASSSSADATAPLPSLLSAFRSSD